MATWTYTVTYIGNDTNTVYTNYPYSTDITGSVIAIEKFDEYVKENKFICPAERYKNKQGLRCEGPAFKCTFCYTGNKNVTYIKDTVVNKIQKLYKE